MAHLRFKSESEAYFNFAHRERRLYCLFKFCVYFEGYPNRRVIERLGEMEDFSRGHRTVSYSEENMSTCASHIRDSELVAFPTETVYGLGANALSPEAVVKIFKAKKRPMNDPVIVHVTSFETCIPLFHESISKLSRKFLQRITSEFWPGPLTVVVKASDKVPKEVCGGTGCVGLRYPRHRVAQDLINVSGCPIAAPSANRFGHVSPTSYKHVEDDLGNTEYPIYIIRDPEKRGCEVGIESTVVKFSESEDEDIEKRTLKLTVLRMGGTSTHQLKIFVESQKDFTVHLEIRKRVIKMEQKVPMISPGQLITHYSPNIPSYILKSIEENDEREEESEGEHKKEEIEKSKMYKLEECVFIDFGGRNSWVKEKKNVMAYLDLSESENTEEAASSLFSRLREAEKFTDAKIIVLPNLQGLKLEHTDACHDRLFRAASGIFCVIKDKSMIIVQ